MKKIIHHLRKQPEEVRKHISHVLLLIVAAIMILLWVLNLSDSMSKPETEMRIQQDLQPFSVLKDSIVDGY